jgi:hypothetical protein
MKEKNPFEDAPVIFSYTRAQAIEDGVLVDLTEWAAETGFKIPVACTSTVWHGYIVPSDVTMELGQSERGRAHDLLWILFCAIRGSRGVERECMPFKVVFLQAPCRHEEVTLNAHYGPGDEGEAVLTITLPNED